MLWSNFEKMKHILVIDDYDAVISTFKIVLDSSKYCGHYPDVLDVLNQCEIVSARVMVSMIFLDYELPGYKGVDIMDRLNMMCPQTPIIGMSACDEAEKKFMDHGAIHFLNKPFDMDGLCRLMDQTALIHSPTHSPKHMVNGYF